jgi:hypothetical protein
MCAVGRGGSVRQRETPSLEIAQHGRRIIANIHDF